MNLNQFFEHWRIVENPFRGEEARHDSVFARVGFTPTAAAVGAARLSSPGETGGTGAGSGPDGRGTRALTTFHSDFEKILGDLGKPSTAIVFGEKGSGKTAIRLQIDDRVAAHNAANPQAKVLLVAYDDLNGILDRFHRRVAGKTPAESFAKFRLVDHLDAVLSLVVPRIVGGLLAGSKTGPLHEAMMDLGPEPRKTARKLDVAARRDVLLLQAVYDTPDTADARTSRLRRILRLNLPTGLVIWRLAAVIGWAPAALVLLWAWSTGKLAIYSVQAYAFLGLLALWLVVVSKVLLWDKLAMVGVARRARRQLRVLGRTDRSLARSLGQLDGVLRDVAHVPQTESDEVRYAMLDRLKRTLRAFGYTGMLVVIDRVDEPTMISGDPERMRGVIWPLFNNKFLQQEGIGVKMLLPIELRHALFKESSAFFQEARLDKQSLVERLSWTGAMLYDLCDARLKACLDPTAREQGPDGQGPIGLLDLFAEDVTARDLVDALDQMHQPRDAFKFLYACISEHCSNVTAEQAQWRIPRLVLESVRKQQSERVQQLYRGIRPA